MGISKKSIISMGCGITLASGLIIILVLITAPFVSDLSFFLRKGISLFIFFFLYLVVAPLISRRLNRFGSKKMLGWTFVGIGAEAIMLPAALVFLMLAVPSDAVFLVVVLAYSVVLGIPAGLISAAIGIYLIRSK